MKNLLVLIAAFAVLFTVSACNVTARDDDAYVSVGTEGQYRTNNSEGNFCPPGQAKKGRC